MNDNNEAAVLTRPDIIEHIHADYLAAGADIIETNTFNANAISMADFGMEHLVRGDQLVAAVSLPAAPPMPPPLRTSLAIVAGALGPTTKQLSVAVTVSNPAFRDMTFDQFVRVYHEQVAALVEAGVDLLLVETIFDTQIAKAALFAIQKYFDEGGRRVPIMASLHRRDTTGGTLSGQTLEAFWNSISHVPLLSVGLNCASARS